MKTEKKMVHLLLSVFPVLLLLSCSLAGNNPVDETVTAYSSKKVCIYQYVDQGESNKDLVREYEYTSDGEIAARYDHEYERQSDGVYLNTATYTYKYSDGNPVLTGKGVYQYFKDYYNGVNYNYICYSELNYTYLTGNYSLFGRAITEYDGQAAGIDGDPNENANYTTYTVYDESNTVEYAQTCTWILLPDGYYGYQVERYYEGNIIDENLLEEYVCHYDDDPSYTRYLYEMCHFAYDEQNIYYYTLYSRDNNFSVYQQADFMYNVDSVDDVDANGLFADTDTGDGENDLDQNIELGNIGSQQYVLNYKFNSYGKRTKKSEMLDGKLVSYTAYAYNDDNKLIKTAEYEDGGDYLYSCETKKYTEKFDDTGNYLYVETTCIYDYSSGYDNGSADISRKSSVSSASDRLLKNTPKHLKQNHRI